MATKHKVLWDNGNDCGELSEIYDSEDEAAAAGDNLVREMIALDHDPKEAADCYSFDIIQVDILTDDEKEAAEAEYEQSYDYFNRYIAGDR